jgi:hypothetical protein
MDGKGFLLRVVIRSKRMFSKRLHEEEKLKSMIQDSSQEWITLLACICADGSHLEAALIYPSQLSTSNPSNPSGPAWLAWLPGRLGLA